MAKVLTYNLWHGLSPEGILRFREMEPQTRRKIRLDLQSRLLKQFIDFDVCFFQEVNPIARRSRELASELEMEPHFCRDNSGIRVGKIGAPWNLDSGLCILTGPRQYVESERVLRLSHDGKTWLGTKASFQLSESRSALLLTTYNDESGRTLWVNTHLHHGIEINQGVREQIYDFRKSGRISEGVEEELLQRLQAADDRRMRETETLLQYLESVKDRYHLIIVAGDLNASPESAILNKFVDFGFVSMEPEGESLVSWNPEENQANFILSKDYIPALLLEDLSFDKKTIQMLQDLAQGWEYRPRKIDYILGWSQTGKIGVQSAQLFGHQENNEMAPSDHFGISTEFTWSPD